MVDVSAVFSLPAFSAACLCVLTRQTRSLLSVFEEDSGMLTNYTNELLQALQRVFGAQVGNHKRTRGANVPTQAVVVFFKWAMFRSFLYFYKGV